MILFVLPNEQLQDHTIIRIIKPLQIKYIPQLTPGGFRICWTAYTATKLLLPKTKIMTITNATNEMAKSYGQVIKNYDVIDKVPEKAQGLEFKRERLSDRQNEEINEIFDEFKDEDPTIH